MDELEDALKKKDEDMKLMEERYKKYLEKAKSVSRTAATAAQLAPLQSHDPNRPIVSQVIRTLDPKQNQGSGPEVQALKNQLQEKERMLHSLEVEKERKRERVSVYLRVFVSICAAVCECVCVSRLLCVSPSLTEGDGQDEGSAGIRGEAHRVCLVQHGMKPRPLPGPAPTAPTLTCLTPDPHFLHI